MHASRRGREELGLGGGVKERSNLLHCLPSRGAEGRSSSSCCSEGIFLQHLDPGHVGNLSKAKSIVLGAGQESHRSVALLLPPQQSPTLDNCLVHVHIKAALERGLSNKERYVLGGQEVQG